MFESKCKILFFLQLLFLLPAASRQIYAMFTGTCNNFTDILKQFHSKQQYPKRKDLVKFSRLNDFPFVSPNVSRTVYTLQQKLNCIATEAT